MVVLALRPMTVVLCEGKPLNWLGLWALAPLVVLTASLHALQSFSDRRIQVLKLAMGGLTEQEVTLCLYS
jgi:hypothetical protein